MPNESNFIDMHVWKKQPNVLRYQFFYVMKYFAKLGRSFVQMFRKRSKVNFPLELFSAWTDEGLFGETRYNVTSFLNTNAGKAMLNFEMNGVRRRFVLHEKNFQKIFDFDFVTSIFP